MDLRLPKFFTRHDDSNNSDDSVETFERIVELGRALLATDADHARTEGAARRPATTGLRELMQALARPRQWEQLTGVVLRPQHGAPDPVKWHELFFEEVDDEGRREFVFSTTLFRTVPPEDGVRLDPARHVIFTTPWRRAGLVDTLASIGAPGNPWRYDPINHSATLVEPFGFAFVTGGNHSVAVGLLRGELAMPATELADLSPVLRGLRCDGRVVRRAADGRVVGRVHDPVFAGILELGRLYVEHRDRHGAAA